MAELRQFEFFVLRYVPDAVKDESLNIGILMIEEGANGAGFADIRFTQDWRRVQCVDPQVDVEWLQAVERDIRGQLAQSSDRTVLVNKLQDSLSNVVQLSSAKGCIAADPAREMSSLCSMYLESPHLPLAKRELSGRQLIVAGMRDEFERMSVLPFMTEHFSVAPYTKDGDPMKYDFGYPVAQEIKFLHAVTLRAGVDQAVVLAARFAEISEGIRKKTQAKAKLTAVVEDGLDMGRAEVGFALAMMQEKGLRVARLGEMRRIAEEIRVELGV
jgi:DUF3037 family protein